MARKRKIRIEEDWTEDGFATVLEVWSFLVFC